MPDDRGSAADGMRPGGEGQSMVEFAVTLPVLLLIMTGLATFGVGMNNYLQLTEATSVGARQLAISRQQTNDPCSVVSTAVMAAAPNLTSSSMSFSYLLNGVSYSGTSCSSGSPTTGAAANLVQGKTAQVTVTYPCSFFAYKYNFGACNLVATTTEVVQ